MDDADAAVAALAAAKVAIAVAETARDDALLECIDADVTVTRIAAVLGVGRPKVYRMIERVSDGRL